MSTERPERGLGEQEVAYSSTIAVHCKWSENRAALNNFKRKFLETQMKQYQMGKKNPTQNTPKNHLCAQIDNMYHRSCSGLVVWCTAVLASLGVTYFSELIHIPHQKHIRELVNHPVDFGLSSCNNAQLCILCEVCLNCFESIRKEGTIHNLVKKALMIPLWVCRW